MRIAVISYEAMNLQSSLILPNQACLELTDVH